ncbi:MAG: S8 family serine peptidase [Patescibacteria group bacterium]|nr:S8 family serine peptidase [Patescibacteria group bacterium]
MLKFTDMNKKVVLILAFFLLGNFVLKVPKSLAYYQNIPNDPYLNNQWYLSRIGWTSIWNRNFIGKNVVVAVIDSGINIDHPDLVENIWRNKFEIFDNNKDDDNNGFIDDVNGWDFVNNTPDSRPKIVQNGGDDGLNHGTMIAGIIGAGIDNGIGVSGISSRVKIMSLRALNEFGEGNINDVVRAIDYAINNGADIINLSFSGLNYNQGFKEAIERAYQAGVIVVAAAGNNDSDLDEKALYPACFIGKNNENIIVSVGATDTLDQKANFSSYGKKCVDISAPGISFFSTYFYDLDNDKNKYYNGYWSGTSMSSAVISGSLALIKSANPKLNNQQLLEVLYKSSDNINDLNPGYIDELGSGRVNLSSSVNWALEKWENLSGRFLLFPQSDIKNYKDKFDSFNSIRIVKSKGVEEGRFSAFDIGFNGSVNMVSGDLDGDGVMELIVGAGEGGGPHIRIFDNQGILKGQFFAYDSKFRGGVNVAIGDIDGDGKNEIITAPGPGGGPHIRFFDGFGKLKGQFFAYDAKFSGGVSLAVGDINGDEKAELVVVPYSKGGAQIKIFDGLGELKSQFFAYEENFFGGARVRLGDIYGNDSKDKNDIIISPGPGREPEIKIFDSSGKKLRGIMAYAEKFKNGVNLAVGDLNKDGLDEIITGAGPGGAPHVRAFDGKGELMESFYGLENDYKGGVMVEFIEIGT